MRRRALAVLSAALLSIATPTWAHHASGRFAHGITGPIVTLPARLMPKGTWAVTTRFELISFDPLPDDVLEASAIVAEDLHSMDQLMSPSLSLAYALLDRFSVVAQLPYVRRDNIREGHLELGVPEVHSHGDSKGLGDLTLLGQLRMTNAAASTQAALLAGIKLPTGQTDVLAADGTPFESEHQPGSGSTDLLLGVSVSVGSGRVSFDGDMLGTITGEGTDETNLGTRVNVDAAVSARLGREQEGAPGQESHSRLVFDGVLELNGETHDRQTVGNLVDQDSGGNLIYLSPGLRAGHAGRWSVSASVGFPVFQDLNGTQTEASMRVLVGLGVAF